MGRRAPINVIVHYPATEEGKAELARRVSSVQADFVINTIRTLKCPAAQKLALLDAVIASARREKSKKRKPGDSAPANAELPL